MKNTKNFFYGMLLISFSLLASSGFEGSHSFPLDLSQLTASFLGNIYSLIHTWQIIPFIGGVILVVLGITKE